jgi:biotin-dependent carboxylase-like uncharacterized protein
MSLLVVDPGLFTTVQDRGRPGYRAWGVPAGGAFDQESAGLANALLGNSPDCAVLELTLVGGTYEAKAPLALALAGAPMAAAVRGVGGRDRPLTIPQSFSMGAGDRLTLGRAATGARAYLAVAGGWQTPAVLGSRSAEERLKAGDVLPCAPGAVAVRHPVGCQVTLPSRLPIRVIAGPDAGGLLEDPCWPLDTYRVRPESDRTGLRLEGPRWDIPADPNRVSAPVAPGAVQVAGGQPILLGVACGTMGGYPHVAHVISADLDRVAQARPGDQLRFSLISIDEARRIDRLDLARRRTAYQRVAATLDRGVGGSD